MRRWLFAGLLLVAGCLRIDDVAAAEQAVDQFHSELNASKFDKIYAQAAPDWKQASSELETARLFGIMHGKLGSFVFGKRTSARAEPGPHGKVIRLVYVSKFQKADGEEFFTFRRSGDTAQLTAYDVHLRSLGSG